MSFIKKLRIKIPHRKFFTAAGFTLFFLLACTHAYAATLSVSPSKGNIAAGKVFSVQVLVSSGGQSINAISGAVTFSSNTLELEGISKEGVITLWAQDPTYSNSNGTASFQGVILNGYSGSGGTVATLTFKAIAAGNATIGISSSGSSVLLNDGQGTDALSGTSGASFTIIPAAAPNPAAQAPQTAGTSAPASNISSPPITTAPETVTAPFFTAYQSPLMPGNFVVAKGTASPNSMVTITFAQIMQNGATAVSQTSLPTGSDGTFIFVSDQKVAEGSSYTIVATAPDGQHTTPLKLAVKNSIWFNISIFIAAFLAIKISAWLALLIILGITGYLLHRNHILRQRLRK